MKMRSRSSKQVKEIAALQTALQFNRARHTTERGTPTVDPQSQHGSRSGEHDHDASSERTGNTQRFSRNAHIRKRAAARPHCVYAVTRRRADPDNRA